MNANGLFIVNVYKCRILVLVRQVQKMLQVNSEYCLVGHIIDDEDGRRQKRRATDPICAILGAVTSIIINETFAIWPFEKGHEARITRSLTSVRIALYC